MAAPAALGPKGVHNTRNRWRSVSGKCDSAHFRENRRLYCFMSKLNTSHGHFHHNNGHARPFSLYAGSGLRVHIFVEYGADGWWKIIKYDKKTSQIALQLTPSLSETTSQLSGCYCSLCQLLEHLLFSSTGNSAWRYSRTIQTKFGRTIFANTAVYGLLFRICSVKNAMSHQFFTICSQVRLSREL